MKMIALYIFSAEVHSKEQKDAIKEVSVTELE
jgi:hypothetical protein